MGQTPVDESATQFHPGVDHHHPSKIVPRHSAHLFDDGEMQKKTQDIIKASLKVCPWLIKKGRELNLEEPELEVSTFIFK